MGNYVIKQVNIYRVRYNPMERTDFTCVEIYIRAQSDEEARTISLKYSPLVDCTQECKLMVEGYTYDAENRTTT